MIRARAAVAWAPGEPLDVTEIDVAPPRAFATPMPTPCLVQIQREPSPWWWAWDAVALLDDGHRRDDSLLVDIGSADPFLEEQLRPNAICGITPERWV